MPPAFVLSQDQTLMLISNNTALNPDYAYLKMFKVKKINKSSSISL